MIVFSCLYLKQCLTSTLMQAELQYTWEYLNLVCEHFVIVIIIVRILGRFHLFLASWRPVLPCYTYYIDLAILFHLFVDSFFILAVVHTKENKQILDTLSGERLTAVFTEQGM